MFSSMTVNKNGPETTEYPQSRFLSFTPRQKHQLNLPLNPTSAVRYVSPHSGYWPRFVHVGFRGEYAWAARAAHVGYLRGVCFSSSLFRLAHPHKWTTETEPASVLIYCGYSSEYIVGDSHPRHTRRHTTNFATPTPPTQLCLPRPR